MDNLQKEIERELLDHLGVDGGFEIEELPSYIIREYYKNQLYAGGEVPDDFILREERHLSRSEKEKEIYRRTKMMERLEQERVDPMSSPDEERREEGQRDKGWPQREREDNRLPNRTVKI